MDDSKVTVVIPCHNYGRFLGECLESVVNQTRRPYEVLVVLDSCTDNSYYVAQAYAERYPYVKVFNVRCRDAVLTRRKGFFSSDRKTKYIMWLDADDKIEPQFIAKCLKGFTSSRVGVVSGYTQTMDAPNEKWYPDPNVDPQQHNKATSASLVLKLAVTRSKFFFDWSPLNKHRNDFAMWKAIDSAGFLINHVDACHLYRKHTNNMTIHREDRVFYWDRITKHLQPKKVIKVLWTDLPRLNRGGVGDILKSLQTYKTRYPGVEIKWVTECDDPDLVVGWRQCQKFDDWVTTDVPSIFVVHLANDWGDKAIYQYGEVANAIGCVSEVARSRVPISLQHKTSILPLGGNLKRLPHSRRVDARRRMAIPCCSKGPRYVVGMVARDDALKRIELAANVIGSIPDTLGLFCLDEPRDNTLKYIKQACPNHRIIDSQPGVELGTFYGCLNALLVTSDNETGPLCMIEAGLCGVPTLSTPVGLAHELQYLSPESVSVCEGDFDSLTKGLHKLLREDRDRHEVRESVLYYNTATQMVGAWNDLVLRTLGIPEGC